MLLFKMPHRNSCTDCGAILEKDADVYAHNFDEVRAGLGRCASCATPDEAVVAGLVAGATEGATDAETDQNDLENGETDGEPAQSTIRRATTRRSRG
jgi:hypothetical protein